MHPSSTTESRELVDVLFVTLNMLRVNALRAKIVTLPLYIHKAQVTPAHTRYEHLQPASLGQSCTM